MPIIGHEAIISDLKDISARSVLGHGYIFVGPAMVGKRTVATALGHYLEKGVFEPARDGNAGGVETDHQEVLQDIKIIDIAFMKMLDAEANGDSIGIDAAREVKTFLWQKPNTSARRTLIIDNAELLTTEAQNALLKITEEPPVSSLLIFITSDIESILPTIVSRLPKIYFGAVAQNEIEEWLIKEEHLTKAKAATLAKRSLGKLGIAWRMLHDAAFQKNLELAEAFLKTTPTGRRDFIKKLIDPDDFSLRIFLDAVIMTLAWETPSKAKSQFWHKTLKLYEGVNNFSLNPRLQLEALMK
jgi:DNA polymerase III delta prime subunit